MKSKNKIKSVFFKEDGFTLFEAMLTLLVTCIVFLLISSGLFQGRVAQKVMEDQNQIKWHLFLNQWESYLTEAELEKLTTKQLLTKEFAASNSEERETFVYKKSGNAFIRTKLSGGGYQPLVLDVRTVNISRCEGQIEICICLNDGTVQKGKIYIDEWEE